MASVPKQARTSTRGPVLGIAIFAGLVAAVLTYAYLNHAASGRVMAATGNFVPTVYAEKDIPARALITPDSLVVRNIPLAQAPADRAASIADVEGKISTTPIAAGQAISEDLIVPRGVEMGLAYGVPVEYRAVTVALDPVSGVAGFLKPGDHVDVIATFETTNGQSVTRTVLQNVVLLAVGSQVLPTHAPANEGVLNGNGQAVQPDAGAAKPQETQNATLQVTPAQAEDLVMTAARGRIQLALRPPDDQLMLNVPALQLQQVTGVPPTAPVSAPTPPAAPKPAPAPAPIVAAAAPPVAAPAHQAAVVVPKPAPDTIVVIRGTQASTVTVGDNGAMEQ